MIIRTSQSSILWLQAQLMQGAVIHLATSGSCGVGAILPRSLSSQQALTYLSNNARASIRYKIGPSSSNKTRMYENFLVSTTSVDALGTKHQNVGKAWRSE